MAEIAIRIPLVVLATEVVEKWFHKDGKYLPPNRDLDWWQAIVSYKNASNDLFLYFLLLGFNMCTYFGNGIADL